MYGTGMPVPYVKFDPGVKYIYITELFRVTHFSYVFPHKQRSSVSVTITLTETERNML